MFSPQAVNQRVDAYRGNPQALMQKYAVSQDLLDLLALQQINKEKTEAARQMQLQMAKTQGAAPPSVAEQLEQETVAMTRQEMAQKMAPMAQMQQQQVQQRAKMMGGIASNPAPNMSAQALAKGGIVGFQAGGVPIGGDIQSLQERRQELEAARQRYLRANADTSGIDQAIAATERKLEQLTTAQQPSTVPDTTGAANRSALNKAEAAMAGTTSYTGTRMAPGMELDLMQKAQANPNAEIAQVWADYKKRFPDAGTRSTLEYRPDQDRPENQLNMGNAPADRMLAGPAPVGLEAAYQKHLQEGIGAKPDYTQADAYGRIVTDPTKAIQDQRMAALTRRAEEAARLRDRALAGTENKTPGWLDYLQRAAASGAEGPMAGLKALSMGAVAQREARQAAEQQRLKIEQAHAALVNQLEDAGFSAKEAQIKADELLFGKRGEADKTAAERKKEAATEAGNYLGRKIAADATVRSAQISANAREAAAIGSGKYNKQQIDFLKAQQKTLQDQLNADKSMQYTNPDEYKRLKGLLQRVEVALAEGVGLPVESTGVPQIDLSQWGKPKVK